MQTLTSIDELEEIYGAPVPQSLTKVTPRLTPLYRDWIGTSKFMILSTIGPEGTDASPRGDDGPVVHIADNRTLWLPDWRGNNRIDSLRNIVRDPRVSLMFMVPGCNNVVRVNGTAVLTADAGLRSHFARKTLLPATVAVITIEELYFQCAKALMRSRLWDAEADRPAVPTAGQFLKEQEAAFEAEAYDAGYAEYAKSRMW
ncbi:pyridoxamine 5'-phosphate oxidase family protein [Leisingera sp. ANG-M7]|uniref:pyridoxamine 5'-phosphate oxidase family protein n=1 Tax=Leisingera sp. ANG-M7 TaxID=1577902 RepID=UPI00057E9835|nr:pyridoxamine 5'-phosphate oxidase family protein [Leisingera sp. ANG-M7]KIC36817.1 pyridoxamine 5'-phosphate oxidase [Leisingera sp. ANG-M7]